MSYLGQRRPEKTKPNWEQKSGGNSVPRANPFLRNWQIRIEPATRSRGSDFHQNRYRGVTAEQVSQIQRLLRVQT